MRISCTYLTAQCISRSMNQKQFQKHVIFIAVGLLVPCFVGLYNYGVSEKETRFENDLNDLNPYRDRNSTGSDVQLEKDRWFPDSSNQTNEYKDSSLNTSSSWQTDTAEMESVQGPFDVMLNGYMRSGTTFIGKLLNYRNDTFYWYEPLLREARWTYYMKNGSACASNYLQCDPEPDHKAVKKILNFLSEIYEHKIDKHFNKFLDDLMGLYRDQGYKKCKDRGYPTRVCYSYFVRTCREAKHIATKVLRLDVQLIEPLLLKHKQLKVIQLMRDPRGVMTSRIRTPWYPLSQENTGSFLEQETKALCFRMKNDIEGVNILAKKYPNRVKILQYEDMKNPREKGEAIYKYLEMNPNNIDDRIRALFVENAQYRPDSFRKTLQPNVLDMIQSHCKDVLKMLGLRVFRSWVEMRDPTIPTIQGSLPYAI